MLGLAARLAEFCKFLIAVNIVDLQAYYAFHKAAKRLRIEAEFSDNHMKLSI